MDRNQIEAGFPPRFRPSQQTIPRFFHGGRQPGAALRVEFLDRPRGSSALP
jgi:hypothetical protein